MAHRILVESFPFRPFLFSMYFVGANPGVPGLNSLGNIVDAVVLSDC